MRKRVSGNVFALICGALLVSGCASPVELVLGDRVTGDENRVVVNTAKGAFEGMPLAVAHCSRFGKSARYLRSDGGKPVYDCVGRS